MQGDDCAGADYEPLMLRISSRKITPITSAVQAAEEKIEFSLLQKWRDVIQLRIWTLKISMALSKQMMYEQMKCERHAEPLDPVMILEKHHAGNPLN